MPTLIPASCSRCTQWTLMLNRQPPWSRKRDQPVFCLTPFSEAEFTNAVELGVFIKRYTAREARAVRDYFLSHIRSGVFRVQDLPPDTYALARTLSRRHTAKLGTRTRAEESCGPRDPF